MKWDRSQKHPGGRPRKSYTTTAEPDNGIYYTAKEAAELLGLCKKTVLTRLQDGTLKAKKISGQWKIYKSSLLQGEKK